MAGTTKSRILKKKKWYSVIAPAIFNNVELGETYAEHVEDTKGKKFAVNLFSLIGDPKKQNVNVAFVVDSTQENKAVTAVNAYEINPTFIRRSVRPGKDKIEDSFVCETADKIKVRVKPFLLSSKKITHSIRTSLLKNAHLFLEKEIKENSFEKNIENIVSSRLQKNLKVFLKKVYPLAICEIRIFEKEE